LAEILGTEGSYRGRRRRKRSTSGFAIGLIEIDVTELCPRSIGPTLKHRGVILYGPYRRLKDHD